MQGIGNDLGYAHNFVVPSDGLSGGMAIFWDKGINISFVQKPTLHHTYMYIPEPGRPTFCLSYIYGNPNQQMRNKQWKRMIGLAEAGILSSKPIVALGDFNDIKSNEEKSGGPKRAEYTFNTFRRMLNATGLHELKTIGGNFTWIAYVQLLDWIGSDHKPLILHTREKKWKGIKLFRYDNRWRFKKEIKKEISNLWEMKCMSIPGSQLHIALKKYASWTSSEENAGIGWALYNKEAKLVLHGKAAIEPIDSPLEAEAEALLMAISQIKRLGFNPVTFCGDSAVLYKQLPQHKEIPMVQKPMSLSCPTYIEDIGNLINDEKASFSFQKVPRSCNTQADNLAREGRMKNLNHVVCWNLV
ncbi:unnamed protein product [Brassica oleracea]|uniref:RNase H type-1 domain-containing protein n=1 Tax=Brassica oleracea TaxID=3712 RepID=A0A3P6DEB1_BRAOL|nr:unnamed protein product [Brassica oleracea]